MESRATWPIDSDVMLVRLVGGPVEDRRSNWATWVERVDIDHLSPAAYGLLPGLYSAIEPLDLAHPWIARLRGVYRREWAESRRHLASAAAIGDALTEAGIAHLAPADQQVARLCDLSSPQRLDPPRAVVDWWSAPRAIDVLSRAGWSVDSPPPGESAKARLTRTRWTLSNLAGASAELATSFLPFLVDERREADLWERARSAGDGPPDAHPADLAVAALCDQLDLVGAVRWVPGVVAVLDELGPLDLRPALDRRVARTVLPKLRDRIDFLESENLGRHTGDLRKQMDELIGRHPVPTSPAQRVGDWVRSRARTVRRQPRALHELRQRHGGLTGFVAALRDT